MCINWSIRHFCQLVHLKKYRYRNNLENGRKTVSFLFNWYLQQPCKLENTDLTLCVHVGLTGVLRGKRAQINLMNWPKGLVHVGHHHIMVINILQESPLELLFSFAPSCQIQEEGFFFFFLTTVHLGAVKAANYCHHCPWKCITPHPRAHSIKETEGVINRRPLTFIQRKNRQNKSRMRRLSLVHVPNFIIDVPPQARWWNLNRTFLYLWLKIEPLFIIVIPAMWIIKAQFAVLQ